MKSTIIGVIMGIVTIAALATFGAYYMGSLPSNQQPDNGEVKPPPSPPPAVPSPTPTPTPSPTTPPPGPPPNATPTADVKFEPAITELSGEGLSRTVTAQITNTGSADAHNAWAKVEVFSQGATVKLDGQDSVSVELGTIKAGETVTRQMTLSIGVFDGLKIMTNGAQIVLTIYSDEHTETMSYDYQP